MLRWQLGKKNPFSSTAMQFSSSSISHEQSVKIFFFYYCFLQSLTMHQGKKS